MEISWNRVGFRYNVTVNHDGSGSRITTSRPSNMPQSGLYAPKTANFDILAFQDQEQSGNEINMMKRNHILMKWNGNMMGIRNYVIESKNDHDKPPLEKRVDFSNGGLF